jgi:hypothetical protein
MTYTIYTKSPGDMWRRGRKFFRKLARAKAYACKSSGVKTMIVNNATGEEHVVVCTGRKRRR